MKTVPPWQGGRRTGPVHVDEFDPTATGMPVMLPKALRPPERPVIHAQHLNDISLQTIGDNEGALD